jgi:hypothetical protein
MCLSPSVASLKLGIWLASLYVFVACSSGFFRVLVFRMGCGFLF